MKLKIGVGLTGQINDFFVFKRFKKFPAFLNLGVIGHDIHGKRRHIGLNVYKIVERFSADFVGFTFSVPKSFLGVFFDSSVSSDVVSDEEDEDYETCKNRILHTIIVPDIR